MQNGEKRVRNRYFVHLGGLVGEEADNYFNMLNILHNMDFYSLIPNDDNRGEDGKQLRDGFHLSVNLKNCTVFEMLVGLSIRLEFETAQSQWEKTVAEWFWILIDNLGLGLYDDDMYKSMKPRAEIEEIVQKMLDRKYDCNGNGGLFPLKNPRKDQRKVEIWYQMSEYLIENYPI